MEKYMRETLRVGFNGEESDVYELTTEQIQTLLERINKDAHQMLEDRFLNWAVKEGITLKKQSKNDDRTFLAVLPDLGGMAVTSVTFLSRNASKNWLVYGYSIKESLEPNENNDGWAEPDFSIRAIGYKLTSKGTPSLQESEKCETYLRYWEGEKHTVFESPVQKDIRKREEETAQYLRELEESRINGQKEIIVAALGKDALGAWEHLSEYQRTALANTAQTVIENKNKKEESVESVATPA